VEGKVAFKYHVRRSEREITDRAKLVEVLRAGRYAVLSMCRDDEPYVVTLNYGYAPGEEALYFHCAHEGQKLDFIRCNSLVCGTVIEDRGYIQGECAHAYRTVVFRGEMHVVEALDEKKHAMDVMLTHLEDDPDEVRQKQLREDAAYDRLEILRLDLEDVTGKQGR
jgi:nitroimidazol reductase NimA-like FMN-containing flavoprotein (pyridoxamine 5'-phosphate oxidase superfamily)